MTILNTIVSYAMPTTGVIFIVVALLLFVAVTLVTKKFNFICGVIVVTVYALTLLFADGFFQFPSWRRVQYEVILSDDYSYKELTTYYDVVDTRGEILTIEEKNAN